MEVLGLCYRVVLDGRMERYYRAALDVTDEVHGEKI